MVEQGSAIMCGKERCVLTFPSFSKHETRKQPHATLDFWGGVPLRELCTPSTLEGDIFSLPPSWQGGGSGGWRGWASGGGGRGRQRQVESQTITQTCNQLTKYQLRTNTGAGPYPLLSGSLAAVFGI